MILSQYISLLINEIRQCDDLDDDLLEDLDHVVRRIQAERSAFTRCWSRSFEEDLFLRHPDLKSRIEKERQIKIDSIILLNKHSDSMPKGGSSFRAGSFNQFVDDQLLKFRRRLSSHGSQSPASTPLLKGQSQTSDFIFDMDEEHEFTPLSTPSKVLPEEALLSPMTPLSNAQSKRTGKQRAVSTVDTSQTESLVHESNLQGTPIAKSEGPWHTASPLATPKLSMKDIMDQASSSRTSNLSAGLSDKSSSNRRPSGSIAYSKLSQKERKKLQQQALQNTAPPIELPPSPVVKASPWKPIPNSKAKAIDQSSPIQASGKSTPHLTMRQTIANPGPAKDVNPPKTPTKATPALSTESQPNRSVNSTGTAMSNPSPIQIKSIRHTPMPARQSLSTQHVSMMDILSQQQAEKTYIQGGGEKRSLADIQAEQEFQEWWEKESARVQDEEKAKEKRENNRPNRPSRRRGAGQKNRGQSSKQ
jgi:inhibitor of Bruton tyrosine kinase